MCDLYLTGSAIHVLGYMTMIAFMHHVSRAESISRGIMTMTATRVVQSYSSVFISKLLGTKYYFDTGASITIIRDADGMSNIRDCPPVELQGVTGTRIITKMGDVTVSVKTTTGSYHCLTITDVLYDPLSPVNLISTKQLIDCTDARVHLNREVGHIVLLTDEGETWIPLEISEGIYAFATIVAEAPRA